MAGPLETVEALVAAINRGDLEGALALYAAGAVLVVQPGQFARGSAQVKEALSAFIALRPTLRPEAQHLIEAEDIALYMSRWSLRGTDPEGRDVVMGGESADILRRQPDGRWLIVADNPWGTKLLPPR
jgi:uncharacterized protein (TIGR02246 family)